MIMLRGKPEETAREVKIALGRDLMERARAGA
jgi:hypothetical protein